MRRVGARDEEEAREAREGLSPMLCLLSLCFFN